MHAVNAMKITTAILRGVIMAMGEERELNKLVRQKQTTISARLY